MRGLSSSGLRMMGIMLIIVGLIVASMALSPEVAESGGAIIVFPFAFGTVGGGAAALFGIMFFALFILSSLLPWYMIQRRGGLGDRFSAYQPEEGWRRRGSDTMEYIITTELPGGLMRSIYIESDCDAIHLRSTLDEAFNRSYDLPSGFEVEDIAYNYEGRFLVLKLMLKRGI